MNTCLSSINIQAIYLVQLGTCLHRAAHYITALQPHRGPRSQNVLEILGAYLHLKVFFTFVTL